jgi:hypothetical protein
VSGYISSFADMGDVAGTTEEDRNLSCFLCVVSTVLFSRVFYYYQDKRAFLFETLMIFFLIFFLPQEKRSQRNRPIFSTVDKTVFYWIKVPTGCEDFFSCFRCPSS